jgi:hypothetical protein
MKSAITAGSADGGRKQASRSSARDDFVSGEPGRSPQRARRVSASDALKNGRQASRKSKNMRQKSSARVKSGMSLRLSVRFQKA